MRGRPLRYAALLALLGVGAAAAGLLVLQGQGVTPRALAPYVEKRSSGHNDIISGAGQWLGATLLNLDRGEPQPALLPQLAVGAQAVPAPQAGPAPLARRLVASGEDARKAFAAAAPGDVITFLPGTYRIRGTLAASRPGEAGAPIVVRAGLPGTVTIEFDAGEGFLVSAPYWRFENLTIRGACAREEFCEHAFHVVGGAHHFAAVNNTILDFNAHFKINGEGGRFPDQGLIEANTLNNATVRRTGSPVTPIDLVAASDWAVRRNLISDFVKGGGDNISYGAFAKGAGARTLFEQNVVLCEQRLHGAPGQRVGLSFGGGGTGKPYCRDHRCITEQDQGVMRANLIASCSDAGIYVNSGAASRIVDNTVIDTAGVQVRFPESSAELGGNIVDGAIASRNGAQLRLADNLQTPIALLYLGYHPLRKLYKSAATFDFSWKEAAPRRAGAQPSVDLCGVGRKADARYGAFEDFGACVAQRR
ncbi:MAG: right-handed parallel beta-helix repeat-containing protein [Massilia sp.]